VTVDFVHGFRYRGYPEPEQSPLLASTLRGPNDGGPPTNSMTGFLTVLQSTSYDPLVASIRPVPA
jgi:hypothetical protein